MFLIVGLLVTFNAVAYDFEVGGIYYNITSESDRKVSVTYENEPGIPSSYSGVVIILSKVLYNSIEYNVTSIGELAFQGCSGSKSVYCKAVTPPTAGYSMFDSETLSGTLYIPNGSIGAYKAVEPWGNFANVIETGVFPDGGVEGIESIGINVAVKGGAIEVRGAEGERIEVYSLSGQCGYGGMETTIPVAEGIYIVRVAGTVHKVIL